MVKIFCRSKEAKLYKRSNGGLTPFMFVVLDEHEGAVKILLGQEGINPIATAKQSSCMPLRMDMSKW